MAPHVVGTRRRLAAALLVALAPVALSAQQSAAKGDSGAKNSGTSAPSAQVGGSAAGNSLVLPTSGSAPQEAVHNTTTLTNTQIVHPWTGSSGTGTSGSSGSIWRSWTDTSSHLPNLNGKGNDVAIEHIHLSPGNIVTGSPPGSNKDSTSKKTSHP